MCFSATQEAVFCAPGKAPSSTSASLAALARGTPPPPGKGGGGGGEGQKHRAASGRVKPGAEAGGSDLIRAHLEMISPQII